MTTVLLIRHGRTKSNTDGVLAGWSEGIGLDEKGRLQAKKLGRLLRDVPLSALVSSPLQRCAETSKQLSESHRPRLEIAFDERVAECRYGDWTGKKLKTIAKQPLWRVVQDNPSAAHFPGAGGESLLAVSQRANEAIAYWVSKNPSEAKKPEPIIAVVSHGDVIKSILANALGMHLDMFQRLVVDPCSVSIVRHTPVRPFVLATNLVDADFGFLIGSKKQHGSDAAVGGGRGARS